MNHIVERYADASAEVTNGSDMLDSLKYYQMQNTVSRL